MRQDSKDKARTRLGQGLIPFWDDFFFQHELRNGEWTALPGGRANVEGGLGARRVRRHYGEHNCHASLECLMASVLGQGLLAVESVVWTLKVGERAVAVALGRASDKAENTSYR